MDKSSRVLKNKAGIYIFQYIDDKTIYYIGSTKNILQRFRQHRYRVSKGIKSSPVFYNYVLKYGWNKFRYGILEYVDLNENLINKEQFYLDTLKPTLNINKIAGSMLGFKHSTLNRLNFSITRRGKSFKQNMNLEREFKPVSLETRNLLKERSGGVSVLVINKQNITVNKFKTIKETANYYGLSPCSISKYLKSKALWCNTYSFVINSITRKTPKNNNPIINTNKKGYEFEVLDKNRKVIFKYNSIRSASRHLNISRSSLIKYSTINKI
jgi:hypothetical protein